MAESLKDLKIDRVLSDKYGLETAEYFVRKGWKLGKLSELETACIQDTKVDDPFNCVDSRRYIDNPNLSVAPAFFGAIHGFVALLDHGISVKERQERVVNVFENLGLSAADHGDDENGNILGCAFNREWVGGKILWLPKIAGEDIEQARIDHNLQHQTLRKKGYARIKGLCLNLEPNSVVVPNGECYAAELAYAVKIASLLNLSFRDVLSFTERVGSALIHGERVVYIC